MQTPLRRLVVVRLSEIRMRDACALADEDSGRSMLFNRFEGLLRLTLHSPCRDTART